MAIDRGTARTAEARADAKPRPPAPVDQLPDARPVRREARKALELTFREALRLGHNYIGTEHILIVLLEVDDGSGPLTELGLDKAEVERAVSVLVSSTRSTTCPENSRPQRRFRVVGGTIPGHNCHTSLPRFDRP